MTVVAHAGHWLINLLYAAPVIGLVGLLLWDRFRHRGEDDRPE